MYRLDWKTFKQFYKAEGTLAFNSLHRDSGIYQSYKTEEDMLINLGKSFEDTRELISDLEFYRGKPIVAIDHKAANIIRGRKARGKMWDVKLLRDDHGAIVIMGESFNVDPDKAEEIYEGWLEEREKHYESVGTVKGNRDKSSEGGAATGGSEEVSG